MLTKTSIILFLMLITFSLGEGLREESVKAAEQWTTRMPSRLQSKRVSFRAFILNGSPARIEDWKQKLSIRQNGNFFCGASVIASQWALTAAHCLERLTQDDQVGRLVGSVSHSCYVTKKQR
jgi:secreted trypsin-like serine protease